ncbi:NADP-dependent oxidoreductase domain-containing protein [Xylogone sp. PMI_703]|nr:NADP-dependent oxidoreductase domain-containing protein [Xylogone sp. PMI_703]
MPLPTRALGRGGPQVTAVGFGLMSIGGVYGDAPSDEDRFRLLDRAHEIGETFWDTADAYFDSEDVVGKWFKRSGKRDDIFIATKFGFAQVDGQMGVRSDPEHIFAACERSLQRLGIKTIDLYYCHRVDGKTPIEKTVEAMVELKKQGKIRYLGLSEVSAATLRRAHAIHPISAVQVEYSPMAMDIEEAGLLDACRELGVAVVAYSPLGRGVFSGKIKTQEDYLNDQFLRELPRFSAENWPHIQSLIKKLEAIAQKKGCTTGQLVTAWLMAQGDEIIPIPGTRSIKYLEQNVGAVHVKLTEEEKKEIRAGVDSVQIKGDRYAGPLQSLVLADTPPL